MQVGFFTKKTIGEPESTKTSEQRKAGAPRKSKPLETEPVLPPSLRVRVPAEAPKSKKARNQNNECVAEMDIECFLNYFLVKFKMPDGSRRNFELVDTFPLDRSGIWEILADFEIVTYGGIRFDLPILNYALNKDIDNREIKTACDDLIKNELSPWRFEKKHNLRALDINHYDLSELCPPMTSLKLMGARLHSDKLQELPYQENTELTAAQIDAIDEYCDNDVDITALLREEFAEDVELRCDLSRRYGIDLRSRSDAQCAEDIFKAEVEHRTRLRIAKPKELHSREFKYQIPNFISFTSPRLQEALDILRTDLFVAKPVSGGISGPERLDKFKVEIGGQTYTMGIGGLHSTEKSAFHLADDEFDLWDFDVTSYYPAIILNSGLFPPAIGSVFLDIYEDIVNERITAKRAGNKIKADGMKITVNGAFGKFGSPWSVLYAPELMIQVTLTGQLSILMLIERLNNRGIQVVSGNTDGIIVKPQRDQEAAMKAIVKRWEHLTGFNTEETRYAGLWSRDVNNYIAIAHDGKVKAKGSFGYAGRKKNPEYDICTDALISWFRDGIPVEKTIRECTDIRKFLSVRRVNGGAVKDGTDIGKVVRWYYSTAEQGKTMHYATTGNKVPQSDGAKPLAILPDKLPQDVDYDWYIKKCTAMFY